MTDSECHFLPSFIYALGRVPLTEHEDKRDAVSLKWQEWRLVCKRSEGLAYDGQTPFYPGAGSLRVGRCTEHRGAVLQADVEPDDAAAAYRRLRDLCLDRQQVHGRLVQMLGRSGDLHARVDGLLYASWERGAHDHRHLAADALAAQGALPTKGLKLDA